METFGEYLRSARSRQKKTQRIISDQIKMSVQAISQWENNDTKPKRELLEQIASAYDVPLSECLDRYERKSVDTLGEPPRQVIVRGTDFISKVVDRYTQEARNDTEGRWIFHSFTTQEFFTAHDDELAESVCKCAAERVECVFIPLQGIQSPTAHTPIAVAHSVWNTLEVEMRRCLGKKDSETAADHLWIATPKKDGHVAGLLGQIYGMFVSLVAVVRVSSDKTSTDELFPRYDKGGVEVERFWIEVRLPDPEIGGGVMSPWWMEVSPKGTQFARQYLTALQQWKSHLHTRRMRELSERA